MTLKYMNQKNTDRIDCKVHLKASLVSGLVAGAISGFCGGLFNIGGPPMVAYFLSVTDELYC